MSSHGRSGSMGGGSRSGSVHGGSPSRSQRGSPSRAQPNFPEPLGYDPGRDPTQVAKEKINTRIDLPPDAFGKEGVAHPFTRRPGFNKVGQDINVFVNQFRVRPGKPVDVHQYDVSVTPDKGKTQIIKKVWACDTVDQILKKHTACWIFDGRKLAWSPKKLTNEIRVQVDLDKEYGRKQSRNRDDNTFFLVIRYTKTVRLECLSAYLKEKMEWNNSVLECMNFIDHVIRQGGEDNMLVIKRLFFPKQAKGQHLDANIDVYKGFYASVRLCQSIQEGGTGLGMNVDVSNTCFWRVQSLDLLMMNFIAAFERKFANIDHRRLSEFLKPVPVKDNYGNTSHYVMSEAFKILRKLTRLRFDVYHRGKTNDDKTYVIKRFVWSEDPAKYGPGGGNAKAVKFIHKQTGVEKSVFQHYWDAYNISLNHWDLPCIESSRGGFFPPECCNIQNHQRYNFKLDPTQTAEMIKFAVTRPTQRRSDIMAGASQLDWANDPWLKDFGVQIDCQFSKTKAKLLKNPEVGFGNGKLNPGVSGRWDLRGRKFVRPNTVPLKAWAFAVTDGCVDKPTVDAFIKTFMQIYQGHGGRIENPPQVLNYPQGKDHASICEDAYKNTGNKFKMTPQIIFFIFREKSQWIYTRVKKNMDCRWAVLSQVLQAAHVRKGQPQYCSNVSLKVNCKLGGQTSRIPGPGNSSGSPFFKRPTMMIGADVTHPNPGVFEASMAALTVSMDKDAAVYHAACETNGYRTEIIQPAQTHSMFRPLLASWMKRNGAAPEHVFYFRDGVSEGEFAQVMDSEVKELRRHIRDMAGKDPKITVIVATKRHHVRFFPEKGDKNNNPLPGTLVEREVTHPFHYDFYLCSHVAIQGTARPVHYHVLHDEVKMPPDELQTMIYHQCYQYQRATTPVSLHPAVYYAHIAGTRARAHEDVYTSERMPRDQQPRRDPRRIYKDPNPLESESMRKGQDVKPLIPMGGNDARQDARDTIRNTMWFI